MNFPDNKTSPFFIFFVIFFCAHFGICFQQAAESGDDEAFFEAIKNATDINQVDENNKSALLHAARHGRTSCLEKLLRIPGINVNDIRSGFTPLMSAIYYGHKECVMRLLEFPDIDLYLNNEETVDAFSIASQECHKNRQNAQKPNACEIKELLETARKKKFPKSGNFELCYEQDLGDGFSEGIICPPQRRF